MMSSKPSSSQRTQARLSLPLRTILARWQSIGMIAGVSFALFAALLDARRNGPLSLYAQVWPMVRAIGLAGVGTLPVSTLLCLFWLRLAQVAPAIEQRRVVRTGGLAFLALLQSLLCFLVGALLTGRFAEVWAITDRFTWFPSVPALVILVWPVMAAWLLLPRLFVPSLRGPLAPIR